MSHKLWSFYVLGRPRPKGSLSCLGGGNGRKHNMVEDVEGSKPWKLAMVREIRRAFGIEAVYAAGSRRVVGFVGQDGQSWPYTGAVKVYARFAFDRDGCTEEWPTVQNNHGDTDKLCRNLGDALEMGGLIKNDSLIVAWDAAKAWASNGEQAGVYVVVEPV